MMLEKKLKFFALFLFYIIEFTGKRCLVVGDSI